jgi:hypothetical protein
LTTSAFAPTIKKNFDSFCNSPLEGFLWRVSFFLLEDFPMSLKPVLLATLIAAALPAAAADVNISGAFTYNNDMLVIPFTLDNTGTTAFFTDSWQGGRNFSPFLALYDSSGYRIATTYNDNTSSRVLTAGDYFLGVTDVYFTSWIPVTNAAAFTSSVRPNLNPWSPGTEFNLYLQGVSSIGSLSYTSGVTVASVSGVPEPETYAMLLAGLGLMGLAAKHRRKSA